MFKIEDFKCSNWRLQLFRTDRTVHLFTRILYSSSVQEYTKYTKTLHLFTRILNTSSVQSYPKITKTVQLNWVLKTVQLCQNSPWWTPFQITWTIFFLFLKNTWTVLEHFATLPSGGTRVSESKTTIFFAFFFQNWPIAYAYTSYSKPKRTNFAYCWDINL